MRVTFWGVRGSTPTPGTSTLKYGGNTSCVEVRTAGGQLLIFDAGSGVRALGQRLAEQVPEQGHRIMLFLTHYHWDHIQGLPFFEPMYRPANYVYLHGFRAARASAERVLSEQMANPFFPVDMSVMRATRNFYDIREETLQIGDARLTARRLNHPQGCLGYRVEQGGRVLVYATDHEHGVAKYDRNLRELADNADVLIYDAQYTPEEYPEKKGWGHSTWAEGVKLARAAGVKQLILFHHDPDHNDYMVDTIVQEARREFPNVYGAAEGMRIDLARLTPEVAYQEGFEKRGNFRHRVPLPMAVRGAQVNEQIEAENISLDGAYFLADRPLQTGEQLEVEIQLNTTEGQTITAPARVVRCERVGEKAGIGITFR